mmetsp:Transcript_47982/g.95755  ORF Transcript_47982/g.95755 Transcript_47982/m.95755 type:complete len:229 (+) Transcript_47982:523-1209(+)
MTAAPTPVNPNLVACSTLRCASSVVNEGEAVAPSVASPSFAAFSLSSSPSSSASSTAVSHRSGGESPAVSNSSANAKRNPPSARARWIAAALSAGDRAIATTRENAGDASVSSTSPLTSARSYARALSDSRTISSQVPTRCSRARVAMTRSQRGAISTGVMLRKRRRTCSSPFSKSSTARPSVRKRVAVETLEGLPDGSMPSSSPHSQAALTSRSRSGVAHLAECALQ